MNNSESEKSFYQEVLLASPDAALPKNLNDEWLDLLLHQAQEMHDKKVDAEFPDLLNSVLKILFVRNGTEELSITGPELFKYLDQYSIELSFEKISRVTKLKIVPATMDSILTGRTFEMTAPVTEFFS